MNETAAVGAELLEKPVPLVFVLEMEPLGKVPFVVVSEVEARGRVV